MHFENSEIRYIDTHILPPLEELAALIDGDVITDYGTDKSQIRYGIQFVLKGPYPELNLKTLRERFDQLLASMENVTLPTGFNNQRWQVAAHLKYEAAKQAGGMRKASTTRPQRKRQAQASPKIKQQRNASPRR